VRVSWPHRTHAGATSREKLCNTRAATAATSARPIPVAAAAIAPTAGRWREEVA
jgi:hypothetical protein